MNNELKSTRVIEVDIIKAIGIILMVAGHSGAPFSKFIYLFHMAVFFIASGFCYKSSSSDSIKAVSKVFLSKIKSLWLPFFIWSTIYILLHNFFLKINIYTDDPVFLSLYPAGNILQTRYSFLTQIKKILKAVFFFGGEQMSGAFWFLSTLFFISVLYCFIDYLLKKIFCNEKKLVLFQGIVAIIFLMLGYYCSVHQLKLFSLPRVASYYCLYFIGYLFSIFKEKYINRNTLFYFLVWMISFSLLLVLNQLGAIGLSTNSYMNPIFLLSCSTAGWGFLFSSAFFIKRIFVIKKILCYIGQNTLSIVILHFLCMKIVTFLIVKIYNLPMCSLAAFPNLYGNIGLWWLIYTLVGTIIPIMFNSLYRLFIKKKQ